MSELKSRKDIDKKLESDRQKKEKGTQQAGVEVGDKKIISETDKATRDAGTEEGGKELNKAVKGSMDKVDKEHEKQSAQMTSVFNDIDKVEKDFSRRKDQTNDDAKTIASGTAKMKSRESTDSQRKMRDAEGIAKKDADYLGKSAEKERTTRTEGEKEMSDQKSKLASIKPKVR